MALHSSVCTKMHPKIISTKSLLKAKKKKIKKELKEHFQTLGRATVCKKESISVYVSQLQTASENSELQLLLAGPSSG
jgi:hypothetical protein